MKRARRSPSPEISSLYPEAPVPVRPSFFLWLNCMYVIETKLQNYCDFWWKAISDHQGADGSAQFFQERTCQYGVVFLWLGRRTKDDKELCIRCFWNLAQIGSADSFFCRSPLSQKFYMYFLSAAAETIQASAPTRLASTGKEGDEVRLVKVRDNKIHPCRNQSLSTRLHSKLKSIF